jgi:hypothetical protein
VRRRRIAEILGVLVIVLLTFTLTIATFYFQRLVTKQRILFHELRVLRTSVNLYRAVNNHNPRSLDELATATFSFPGENVQRKYLDYRVQKDGGKGTMLLDPFGNPYYYNAETGWVRSSTSDYKFW